MRLDAKTVQAFHCPRWEELPALPLYMDQVVMVLQEALELFTNEEELVATPSMVNNYVKQRLIPPPDKKRYGRKQVGLLVMISLLKRVLSMTEIDSLLCLLAEEHGIEAAYDLFCKRLEMFLVWSFSQQDGEIVLKNRGRWDALDAALASLMGKLLVQQMLDA